MREEISEPRHSRMRPGNGPAISASLDARDYDQMPAEVVDAAFG